MKVLFGVIVTIWLGWIAANVAGNGILVRLNGRTVQTLHLQSHLGWSDYCYANRPSTSSLRNTLSVICHSLGYERSFTYSYNYRSVIKPYSVYNINCAGTESSLEECNVLFTTSRYCYYHYPVTCRQCAVGAVRLTGGLIPQQGQVEVCLNGSWSRVCSSSWNQRDAIVVCRQLNFPVSKLSYSTLTTYKLQNAGFIASSRHYNCYGNESRLIDCRNSTSTSCLSKAAQGYYQYRTLYCKGDLAITGCTSGSLRLYEGENNYEGKLLICTNGTWLQVISYNWDSLDGEVACRQLGLLHSGGTTITWLYTSDFVSQSPLGLRCAGSERRLQDCPYSVTISNYYSGIYLRCQMLPQSRATCRREGQVRLVGGSTSNEGRVEICIQGVWGSICRNSWGTAESAIVCEQLGFQSENSTNIYYHNYGDGNKPILLSDLYCIRESSLLQCNRRSRIPGAHTCSAYDGNTVAVRCDDSTCRHGDVRLYGRYVSFEGVPEICINGQWAYACSSSWGLSDSTVFCRHLLNVQNVKAIQSSLAYLNQNAGSRMSVSSVTCSSSSPSSVFTRACSYNVRNSSCSYLTVGCYVNNCTSGSVRIVPVSSSNDGVVEICQDGVWGGISSSSWDYRDARVICKQLRQPWEKSLASSDSRQIPLVWYRARCSGYENSISNCTFSNKYSFSTSTTNNPILYSYPYYIAAAVICRGNDLAMSSSRCAQGAIRLANKTQTSTLLKGRLEVCDGGEWKVVCYSGYWQRKQSELLCKELFIGHFSRVSNRYASSGDSATQGIMSSFRCPSNAQDITSCYPRYYDYISCHTTSLVGISCEDTIYKINVTSVMSDGIYELESTMNFSCSISPTPTILPPNGLRYTWTIPGIDIWPRRTSSSIYSLYIDYKFPKLNDIHCEVQDDNGYVFGSGYYSFKVNNPIQVIDENSYQTSNGSTYIEASIANITLYTNFMSELAWHHNNHLLSRVNLSLLGGGRKSLQTHVNPGGDFKVRFEGFLTVPYDRKCEKSLLDALEIYPAFKGVQTSFNQKDNGPESQILLVSTNLGSSSPILYTVNESVTLNVAVDLSHDSDQYFGKTYYLAVYERESSLYWTSFSNTNYWSRAFTISNTPTFRTVVLTIVLFSSYSTEFRTKCETYYRFIRPLMSYSSRLIKERRVLQINYYENLSHSFSAEKYDYYYTESTSITCNGSVNFPLFKAVSISKGNVTIIESESGTVKFSTRSLKSTQQQYGVYTCTVYTREGVNFIKEIYIQNQVRIEAILEFIQRTVCQDDKAYMQNIISDFTRVLHQLCNCAINSSHISNATLSCPGSSSSHGILNATLTYSNDNGNITATSVAQMLYAATLAQTEKLVIGEDITIGSVRFSNGSKFNVNDLQEASGQPQSTIAIVGVGSFLLGVVLALLCLGIFMTVVCCRKNKSSSMDIPNSGVSRNLDNESKYTAGPKSSHSKGKNDTEALSYEEPVQQTKSLPCDADMEQPLYEHIDVDYLQKDIVMSPNLGYEGVAISRM